MIYVTHDQVEAMTLADRIVIMRDGRIEQAGSPLEVFERPVNTFVASFIGSPPMNLLDAAVEERAGRPHAVLADGTALPLPTLTTLRGGAPIVVGFRAEALTPRGHGLPGTGERIALDRTVTLAEPLGTETLLFTTLGGREVQGKMLAPRPVTPGERLPFELDVSRLHVFDKADGHSLAG